MIIKLIIIFTVGLIIYYICKDDDTCIHHPIKNKELLISQLKDDIYNRNYKTVYKFDDEAIVFVGNSPGGLEIKRTKLYRTKKERNEIFKELTE